MAERDKFTPIEKIFPDPGSQAMVRVLREGVSAISGVKGIVVGYIRGERGRNLYVVVDEGADVDAAVSDAINRAFPDRIARRQWPCVMVTDASLADLKEEFHGGRKMVFDPVWKR